MAKKVSAKSRLAYLSKLAKAYTKKGKKRR